MSFQPPVEVPLSANLSERNSATLAVHALLRKVHPSQTHGQTKSVDAGGVAPSSVHAVLGSSGQPLDAATRAFMEPRLGHDFSQVRVHDNTAARDSAREVNALAYTVGRNIVFGPGQYSPTTAAGRKLLTHELVHVAQQGSNSSSPNASLSVGRHDSPDEREAENIANHIHQPASLSVCRPQNISRAPIIQRREAPSADERQFWLRLGQQPHYGVPPVERRTRMASQTGNQNADEVLWTLNAVLSREGSMRAFLQTHFGADRDLRVTSVVKDGEHTAYRKADVAPAGKTTWEELAAAAVHAGFWVHAEGVKLGGKTWPLSPKATGPHLDLYLIKTQPGDFPAPSTDKPSALSGTGLQTT